MRTRKHLKGFTGELYSDYVNMYYEFFYSQDFEMGARFIEAIQDLESEIVSVRGRRMTREQKLSEELDTLIKKAGYSLASPYYVEACGKITSFTRDTIRKFKKENLAMGIFTH